VEVVGRPKDLKEIDDAIKSESRKAQGIRMATA
jgi:hypothetical protein